MNLSLAFFAFTSMWHSVQGGETTYLRERDVEAPMAKTGGSPGLSAVHPDDLQKGSSLGLRKGRKDARRLTCGNGQVGDGTCPNEGECCSEYGWCGTSAEHCGGSPEGGSTGDNGTIGLYCGSDWSTASACSQPCPGGLDIECPSGETCFGEIICASGGGSTSGPEQNECGLGTECPLRACCSKFGYCGWTDEFCVEECQSNCENPSEPPGQCSQETKMIIKWAYYASWAADRVCDSIRPSMIDALSFTHLAYSFAIINENGLIDVSAPSDYERMREFNALKDRFAGLKTAIAVGGWAFNDPPTERRFSTMAATEESRSAFAASAVLFMREYGFSGLDLDWEYPGAPDRGGSEEDFENYVHLVAELRRAFNAEPESFELTMAVPLSNWYLRHFDLSGLAEYVDWFNVMSYDIHGAWDANIESLGPIVRPHTDMQEIRSGMQMFYKNRITGDKIVLGLAAYARTFTLADTSCTGIGCEFRGAGAAGECTASPGVLSNSEVERLIDSDLNISLQKDDASGTMVLVKGDQWITFDRPETRQVKTMYADQMCFRGTMYWSIDMLETSDGGNGIALTSLDYDLLQIARAAFALGLDTSLSGKIERFIVTTTEAMREELKRSTMAALSLATEAQFLELMDPENQNFVQVLQTWDGRGAEDTGDGKDQRTATCEMISQSTSSVPLEIKDCMCGGTSPFVRCMIMLGNASLRFHARRSRDRQLIESRSQQNSYSEHKRLLSSKASRRDLQATCELKSSPPELLGQIGGNPTLEDLLEQANGEDVEGISITGECAMALPAPLNFLEVQGSVEVAVPETEWTSLEGATEAIAQGLITQEGIVQQAGSLVGKIEGSLCFALESTLGQVADEQTLQIIEDTLEFFGVSLCFAALRLQTWPLRGHSRFEAELNFMALFARAGMSFQASTAFRDALSLCDGIEPNCGDKDTFFCNMGQNEVMGHFDIGIDFLIFKKELTLNIGGSAYDDCDKYGDGTLCLLGTSCTHCLNPATYWYGKAFTACGTEPQYPDGTICLVGTSCNACQNTATFWPDHRFTWACGQMPCWGDGTICAAGTTCASCCNGDSFWPDHRFTQACGQMPCWGDGTVCVAGTTCASCCNGDSFWPDKFTQACGQMPCWGANTRCLEGTTCNSCCNGSRWVWEWMGHHCN